MTDAAPPVPAAANLQSFDWTPINRRRLFASAFHAAANDSEWRAGVTLWLKSWDQVPAGSLPDDDAALCRLAEMGTDVKRWKKVRGKAMHGWTKHADGRLYHTVVTETVLEALGQKEAARIRREQVAERNRQWRERRENGVTRRNGDASRDGDDGVTQPSSNLYDQDRTRTGPRTEIKAAAAAQPLEREPLAPPPLDRILTLADLRVLHPAFTPLDQDDHDRAKRTLALYGSEPACAALTALEPIAAARPANRRRIMVSEWADWLSANVTLAIEDYARAGLTPPDGTPTQAELDARA